MLSPRITYNPSTSCSTPLCSHHTSQASIEVSRQVIRWEEGGRGGGRGGTTAPAALERVQLPYLTSPTQLPPLAPHTVHAHTLELYTRSWHSSSIKFVAWSYPRSVPCSSRAAAAAGVGGWGGRRRGRGCQALGVVQVDQHDAARAGSSTHHYRPAIVGDHRHRRCEQGGGSGQGRGRRQ